MTLLNDGPAPAGQSSSGTQAADNPGSVTTPAAASSSGSESKSWRDSLPEEMKSDTKLQQFSDVAALAKAYQHAHSLIGKKGVIPPTEKSSDEEWQQFFKTVGVPELEKYEVKAPGDQKIDEGFMKKFKETAQKSGVLPKQAQALLELYTGHEKEAMSAQMAAQEAKIKQEVESLKREWGDGFEKQVSLAKLAAKELGGEEFRKYVAESPLGNDVKFVKFLASVGKLLGEDKIRGEMGGGFGKTPSELKAELNKITHDFNHPYYDRNHPGHKAAVEQVAELQKRLHS